MIDDADRNSIEADGRFVWVRRNWRDARCIAKCQLSDLSSVQLDLASGGGPTPAPRFLLHACVWCDAIRYGELAHCCARGTGPHRIEVFVVGKDNDPAIFAQLRSKAGDREAEIPDVGAVRLPDWLRRR